MVSCKLEPHPSHSIYIELNVTLLRTVSEKRYIEGLIHIILHDYGPIMNCLDNYIMFGNYVLRLVM